MNSNKLSIVIILLLLAFNITAFKSNNTTDVLPTNDAVVAVEKTNILYIGLENPISVAVPGEKLKDVTISCSEGLMGRKISDGHYILEVQTGMREVFITSMVKGKQRGRTLFRVRSVPKPFVSLGTITGGKASIQNILLQSTLHSGLDPSFVFDGMRYTITKYNFTFFPSSRRHMGSDTVLSDMITFTETGRVITPRITEYIKYAKSGDQIQISAIEAMGPGRIGLVRFPSAINIIVE